MEKKIYEIILFAVLLGIIVCMTYGCAKQPSSQDLKQQAQELSECTTNEDCPENQTCKCTGILPLCENCEGGYCIYSCIAAKSNS